MSRSWPCNNPCRTKTGRDQRKSFKKIRTKTGHHQRKSFKQIRMKTGRAFLSDRDLGFAFQYPFSSARSTTMAEVKKIMVAVDDSECSHYALQWALSNLHLYGSNVSLVVFHAQPLAVFNGAATMGVTSPELIETIVNQQRQVSEAILARAKEMCAQKKCDCRDCVRNRGS